MTDGLAHEAPWFDLDAEIGPFVDPLPEADEDDPFYPTESP